MKVTLLLDHEHAGISYPAGAEIDVPDADAAYLMDVGACARDTVVVPLPDEPLSLRDDPLSVSEAAERAGKGRKG